MNAYCVITQRVKFDTINNTETKSEWELYFQWASAGGLGLNLQKGMFSTIHEAEAFILDKMMDDMLSIQEDLADGYTDYFFHNFRVAQLTVVDGIDGFNNWYSSDPRKRIGA